MESLIILAIAYALTLAGLAAGMGRGHSAGTMIAASLFLGPLCGLMALSDARRKCPQCGDKTLKAHEFCPTCGLLLVQESVYWRAHRVRQGQMH